MQSLSDPAAERAVLAAIFGTGNEAYLDVADLITPASFTIDSNQVIFQCLEHIVRDRVHAIPDFPSVLSAANTLGLSAQLEDSTEIKHLRAIINMAVAVDKSNVRHFAAKIRRLQETRRLRGVISSVDEQLLQVTGDETLAEIVGIAENSVYAFGSSVSSGNEEGVVLMGQDGHAYACDLMDNPRETVGISTGMPLFDLAIGGGLRPECFDVVVARQKTGKTFFVDNVALYVSRHGIPVLNIDTEMSKNQHLVRVWANMAKLKIDDIETGKCGRNTVSRGKLLDATKELKDLPYSYLAAAGISFEDILAHMRRWIKRAVGLGPNGKAKPCVIIYDWLKLNSTEGLNKNMAEHQMLGFIASNMKNFMSVYGARCLCFAQANRDGIDTEDTSVVRASDRIVDFCTSLSLFKRKNVDEQAEHGGEAIRYTHKLIPLVQRFGKGLDVGDYINIQAIYAEGRIVEGPTSRGVSLSGPPAGQIEHSIDESHPPIEVPPTVIIQEVEVTNVPEARLQAEDTDCDSNFGICMEEAQ